MFYIYMSFTLSFFTSVAYYSMYENTEKWWKAFYMSSFNILLLGMLLVLFDCSTEIPSSQLQLYQIPLVMFFTETLFWIMHKISHTKFLYSRYHSHHHSWKKVVSASTFDAPFVEFCMCNVAPFAIPIVLVSMPNTVRVISTSLVTWSTVRSHHIQNGNHSLHHLNPKVNFGLGMYWLDRITGTYESECSKLKIYK
jgi:sterol desaturase/sphingolipid hydroxylase (fatty acid hydroxylase superfamily)